MIYKKNSPDAMLGTCSSTDEAFGRFLVIFGNKVLIVAGIK